jgi:NACHT domain
VRDDFPRWVIDRLAERAGYRCSNPDHRGQPTSGPHTDPLKSVNIGVAAHITAASEGGPRYDPAMTPKDRQSIGNGIWLCANCHSIVDRDPLRYTADELRRWRKLAEEFALQALTFGELRPAVEQRPATPVDRNRSKMIQKVRTIWIKGFLEKSLFNEVRIALGLSERSDAVARPMDLLVTRPDEGGRPLPPGTRVLDVYDDLDESLLILGAPGSGKTTLLLELARDLLNRADGDAAHPIPVVFPLSTWAETQKPLAEWLQDELNLRYDVPRKIAKEWVESDQILPLLDGLDEVKAEQRAACVEAINAFRQSHGFLSLVVTSRTADYEIIANPLRIHGAILVNSLTRDQVSAYLSDLGVAGEPLRHALDGDPSFWSLLDSPLLLNMVTLACAGLTDAVLPIPRPATELRSNLFGIYVSRALKRRAETLRYSSEQTELWLAWLAVQMVARSQTVFYLEQLRNEWLPLSQRRTVRVANKLILGLVVGLGGWLLIALILALVRGFLLRGYLIGLVVALMLGLGVGLGSAPRESIGFARELGLSEPSFVHIGWSWPQFQAGLPRSLIIGLVTGSALGFAYGVITGPVHGTIFGTVVGVFMGTLWGTWDGFTFLRRIETSARPGDGIRRSAITGLLFGLSIGLIAWMSFGLLFAIGGPGTYDRIPGPVRALASFLVGSLIGLFFGVSCGLASGGGACLKYFITRLWLIRNGSTPWNYVRFLDYAADRILLRKVGGGYVFLHRMLMEWFAARYAEPGASPSKDVTSVN